MTPEQQKVIQGISDAVAEMLKENTDSLFADIKAKMLEKPEATKFGFGIKISIDLCGATSADIEAAMDVGVKRTVKAGTSVEFQPGIFSVTPPRV